MSAQITLMRNFDRTKLSFGDVKQVGKQGAKIVYVSYGQPGKPLILQTPVMNSPWGLSNPDKDAKGPAEKLSLALSFKGKEFNDIMNKSFEACMAFDDAMLDGLLENSVAWTKTKISNKEVGRALYTPMVKFSRDPNTLEITDKYPPSIRLSVPVKDGEIPIDCFNSDRTPLKLTETTDLRGAKISALIQCTGVWLIGGNKVVPSWKIMQLMVTPNSNTIKGFAFKPDDEDAGVTVGGEVLEDGAEGDEAEEETPTPVSKPVSAAKKAPVEELLPESGDEEDELEKPKPVKKTLLVKKKAAA